jgi:hypothetical protein
MASMSAATIALYKGPAAGWWDRFRDAWVRFWTWSRYSHGELLIDGVAYSSSPRDGGVRPKQINFNTGRWDLYLIPEADVAAALRWFQEHDGEDYDWLGVIRFVLPFIPHRSKKWFCFEAIAASLGLPKPHRWTGRQFEKWLKSLQAKRGTA